MSKSISKKTRRIFAPLLDSDGPERLAISKFTSREVMEAIREAGSRVRVCDDGDPIFARYVFVAGARGEFMPRWEKLAGFLGAIRRVLLG